jgi:hypothetical protein
MVFYKTAIKQLLKLVPVQAMCVSDEMSPSKRIQAVSR